MAPKKRQRGEGSSSQPRYDENSFSSFENFEKFEKKFKARSITLGRKIDFGKFESLNLKEIFVYQGWKRVCSLQLDVYPRLIRLFYANLTQWLAPSTNEFIGIISYVGGKEIKVDFDLMHHLFKIPNRGVCKFGSKIDIQCGDYNKLATMNQITGIDFIANPLTRFKANQLNPLAKILHNIILNFLLPKKGHKDEVNNMETFLIDRLINRKFVNLNYVILKNMIEIVSSPTTSLHYGMIIQTILNHFGVDCSNEDDILVFKPLVHVFNEASAKRMGLVCYEDGTWDFEGRVGIEEAHEEEEEYNVHEEQGEEEHVQEEDSIHALRSDLNEFKVSVNQNFTRMFEQQEEMMRMLRDLQTRSPNE